MEQNNTATPRQRWALYCITKKDYRNEILSKEEAAKMIKELGNPDYKKKSNKTLSEELLDYLKEHFDSMFNQAVQSLKLRSVVTEDKPKEDKPKSYAFIGFGCAITWFRFRKNNKRAEEINEAQRKYRFSEIEKMFLKKFTSKEIKYYEKIGCPLTAIWTQDQNMQLAYYQTVREFAKTKGIEMEIVSHLD